jgi:hypothetical protein
MLGCWRGGRSREFGLYLLSGWDYLLSGVCCWDGMGVRIALWVKFFAGMICCWDGVVDI